MLHKVEVINCSLVVQPTNVIYSMFAWQIRLTLSYTFLLLIIAHDEEIVFERI